MRWVGLLFCLVSLIGCSAAPSKPTYNGPLQRLVVAAVADHSGGDATGLTQQLGMVTEARRIAPEAFLTGIHTLLSDALFHSGRYQILERDLLDEIAFEGEQSRASLLGAELLLLPSLTAVDLGASGGTTLPLPIRLSDQDVGILELEFRTAYLALDLRLVEVSSGRVVATTAVEGRARRMGISMSQFFSSGHGEIRLPGMLALYANTPVEDAVAELVSAAVAALSPQAEVEEAETAASPLDFSTE